MARRMCALPREIKGHLQKKEKDKRKDKGGKGERLVAGTLLYQCAGVHLSSSGCPEESVPREGDHKPVTRSSPAGPHHHWDPLDAQRTQRINGETHFETFLMKENIQMEFIKQNTHTSHTVCAGRLYTDKSVHRESDILWKTRTFLSHPKQ